MTAFSIFAICIVLTLTLFGIAMFFLGYGLIMIALVFPAHAADVLTKNIHFDYTIKSFLYKVLMGFFILLEVIFIAGIFFGLYCLFFGYPTTDPSLTEIQKVYSSAECIRLTYINKLLLLLEVYFVLMFTYYSIKHRQQYATMKGLIFFTYRILPILSYPLAFAYLIGTLRYLSNYPNEKTVHAFALVAGYIYIIYTIYTLSKTVFTYSRILRYGASDLTSKHWINLGISIAYNALFLYFFFQIHASI